MLVVLQGLQRLEASEGTCNSLGGTLGKSLKVQVMQPRHHQADNGNSSACPLFHYQPVKGALPQACKGNPALHAYRAQHDCRVASSSCHDTHILPTGSLHTVLLVLTFFGSQHFLTCAGGCMSVQTVKLSLDVLQLAPNSLPAASLGPLMQTAVHAQLDRFQRMLLESDGPLCDLRALHFQPPGWPHQLTVMYPLRGGGAGKASAQPLKGTCGDNVPRGLWTGDWECSPHMVKTADMALPVQACCRAFSHPHMMIQISCFHSRFHVCRRAWRH